MYIMFFSVTTLLKSVSSVLYSFFLSVYYHCFDPAFYYSFLGKRLCWVSCSCPFFPGSSSGFLASPFDCPCTHCLLQPPDHLPFLSIYISSPISHAFLPSTCLDVIVLVTRTHISLTILEASSTALSPSQASHFCTFLRILYSLLINLVLYAVVSHYLSVASATLPEILHIFFRHRQIPILIHVVFFSSISRCSESPLFLTPTSSSSSPSIPI